MEISRALKIRDRGKMAMQNLYSKAQIYGMQHMAINTESMQILKRCKNTPYWVIAYLEGYESALRENLYRHHLEFCYIVEGVRYSIRKDSEMYYEKHGISPRELNEKQEGCGHYWIKSGKPYSE